MRTYRFFVVRIYKVVLFLLPRCVLLNIPRSFIGPLSGYFRSNLGPLSVSRFFLFPDFVQFRKFFTEKFAQFKKKHYLCSRIQLTSGICP